MIRIERLLAPVDFSEASRPGLERAVALAEDLGAETHILHVIPEPEVAVYSPFHVEAEGEQIRQAIRAAHESAFQRLVDSLPPTRGKRVTELRSSIGVAPTIVGYAEEIDADLLVIGTHGHRGFRRFLLGSVAEEVVRRSPCPVLTHPPGHPTTARAQRILAAIDLSELSSDVLRTAAALATAWQADLRVIHVVSPLPYAGYPEAFISSAVAIDPAALEARAREAVERMLEAEGLVGRASIEIEPGVPQHEIAAAAARAECDLVVLASHGMSGLEHALLGSVAERLLRRAQVPVLVLRADGKVLETG